MKRIKIIIILAFLITLPFLNHAQPDPRLNGNGTGIGTTPVGGPLGAPIDGGLGILLALGAGYGLLRTFHKKKVVD